MVVHNGDKVRKSRHPRVISFLHRFSTLHNSKRKL